MKYKCKEIKRWLLMLQLEGQKVPGSPKTNMSPKG